MIFKIHQKMNSVICLVATVEPGTKNMEHGTLNIEPGTKNMEPGTWELGTLGCSEFTLEPGTWEPGTWVVLFIKVR